MHIWDEPSPALVQLDVYTCSEMKPEQVLPFLEVMEPTKIEWKFLDREKITSQNFLYKIPNNSTYSTHNG